MIQTVEIVVMVTLLYSGNYFININLMVVSTINNNEQLRMQVIKAIALEKGTANKKLFPLPATHIHYTTPHDNAIGMDLIRSGKVAAITMAGGQGTRLGSAAPKGCFELQIGQQRVSLFELQAKRLLGVGAPLWLIMTSPHTHPQTIDFFTKHNHFGYPTQQVVMFQQTCLPMVNEQGEPIRNEDDELIMAPDGNGGIFKALADQGLFDTKLNGILYLHVFSVDNVLVKPADPAFIGHCHERHLQVCSKSVLKRSPSEKAGVFCYTDNDQIVISEYSELAAAVPNPDQFMDANIANHVFTTAFARHCAGMEMPLHVARKPAKVSSRGDTIPALKLERFIFDCFQWADPGRNGVVRVPREAEFAPLKNATGEDGPETCIAALQRQGLY